MKNKLHTLLIAMVNIFGLHINSNCSEVNKCIDQHNNIINCLYYSIGDNKYYEIDENNKKQMYSPKDKDIILDLFSDHNGGFYAYDKYGKEYKYSPQNFKSIQSDKFDLYIVYKCNNIMTLRKYFYIDINRIRNSVVLNNNSDTTNSTKDNTNLAI